MNPVVKFRLVSETKIGGVRGIEMSRLIIKKMRGLRVSASRNSTTG